jgi:hypothetical protein
MDKPEKIVGVYERPEPKYRGRLLWLAVGVSLAIAGGLALIFVN